MDTVEVEINEPWSVTRPDSIALGIFSFQYCVSSYIVGNSPRFRKPRKLECTYLNCLLYYWFAVLDNETKVWVMLGEC
jgi:hypothetical protein